mgnify:CR=1 FL=1
MHSIALVCSVYIVYPPSSDPETAVDVPVIDYVDDDPSSLSAELPGKPSFDHPDIAHSILSHACIRFCYCY